MDNCTVIKIGGNILDDEAALSQFLRQFAALPGKKVLIHGGGKLATRLAGQLGIEQQLVDGRRITDTETLRIVTMVYAGLINKQLVATLQSLGCNAVGLSGADGNLVQAHKREKAGLDYGWVGDVDAVNAAWLGSMLEAGMTVVIAPITHDKKGQLLNTNADTIAQETAKALAGHLTVQLLYSFEKSGVLLDANDESTLIPTLRREHFAQLKTEGKIFAGMIPKLENAFAALDSGVEKVIIGKADNLAALVEGRSGTHITHD